MSVAANVEVSAGQSKGRKSIAPEREEVKRQGKKEDRKGTKEKKDDGSGPSRKESLSGALARALVGTLAFVFRAPVRLFRPVKLSSWNLLEAMAKREGRSLSLRYLRTIMRREKSTFLPHLLIPPLLVNTTIGFCLFEAYSLTEARLLSRFYPKKNASSSTEGLLPSSSAPSFTPLWIVALAGGAAGTAQCMVSAPLDNVRIIISSQVGKKGHPHDAHKRHPLGISWRAVARAAILPFAPEITRGKLVEQVSQNGHGKRATSDATSSSSSNQTQRLLWEKRIKRWRGGVHGAGLIMSLARDSVGFSAFFVVFEMSRRLAFKASQSVDRTLAYFNSSASLPVGQSRRREVQSDDMFHLESTSMPGDVSYSQSRTKTGRIVAAFVLVVGGALGAALYEVVGRPAELMRIVIWEGRKAWEEGRRGTKRDAWHHASGRVTVTGARKRVLDTVVASRGELGRGSFLELRSGTLSGTNLTRVAGVALQRQRRPPHVAKENTKQAAEAPLPGKASSPPSGDRKSRRRGLRLKHRPQSTASSKPFYPPLETRPSAYTLLLEHAQRTSVLRYTSDKTSRHRIRPTPVPTTVLLLHTYFIAPFTASQPAKAPMDHSSSPSATNETKKTTRSSPLANLFRFRYPVSSAPGSVKSISQAQVWGSGRIAWAVRRLASPYAVGFLAFAWMSGDLT